jgi:hypothetical protein
MPRRYYKLDLFTRTLRRGMPLQAIRLAWQVVRSRLFYERRHVYGLRASDLARIPTSEVLDSQIECLSDPSQIEELERELRTHPKVLHDDLCRLQERGALFWVARIDGQLATLGISQRGDLLDRFYFPLMSNVAVLSHFVTFPAFRGRGLYPSLLACIARQLAAAGVECFLIECCDWNMASRQGIERAGYQHIGYGKVTRGGRLGYCPLKSLVAASLVSAVLQPSAQPRRPDAVYI